MSEPTRRLFFALWPSNSVRHSLFNASRNAVRQSEGRAVPLQNLHVTLAFLGSTPESRVGALLELRRSVEVEPFELKFGAIKAWKKQELLCLEPAGGQEALCALVDRLHRSLRTSGFEIEHRPFRAHVTLAREIAREIKWLEEPRNSILDVTWAVQRFELIESRVTKDGSVYRVIEGEK